MTSHLRAALTSTPPSAPWHEAYVSRGSLNFLSSPDGKEAATSLDAGMAQCGAAVGVQDQPYPLMAFTNRSQPGPFYVQ
jgi:hypothetical protein